MVDSENGSGIAVAYLFTNSIVGTGFIVSPGSPNSVTNDLVVIPGGIGDAAALFSMGFSNITALEAAYPAGAYQLAVKVISVNNSVSVNLPANSSPTPHVANYTAAQTVNASNDFTLNWDAYVNPTSMDTVDVQISETNQLVFRAQNQSGGNLLLPTATSVVIPKGTLKPGKTYLGELVFGRLVSTNLVMQPNGRIGAAGFSTFLSVEAGIISGPTRPRGVSPPLRDRPGLSGSDYRLWGAFVPFSSRCGGNDEAGKIAD